MTRRIMTNHQGKRWISLLLTCWLFALLLSAQSDSIRIEQWLADAPKGATSADLNLFFARKMLGLPYVAHTLEVNKDERLVVNTRELDCTTLVETTVALTLCARQGQNGFAHFKKQLQQLRYRGGKTGDYTTRIHYFTDWIVDNSNKGLIIELQSPNPPFKGRQHIHLGYMTSHPNSYDALKRHPEFIPVIRRQELALNGKTFRYIPKSEVRNTKVLRQTVSDGDIIAITSRKKGLDIAHLGFAVWHHDGLHLLNASQLHKKVVEEPMTLERYLSQHPTHTGIRILRLKH